jgi:hypothetical protein
MYDALSEIFDQFPLLDKDYDIESILSTLFKSGQRSTFNPSQGTVEALKSTSTFELISDPILRKEIIAWNGIINDFKEQEGNVIKHLDEIYQPFIFINFPIGTKNHSDKRLNIKALESLEFENIISSRRGKLSSLCKGYENIDMVGEAIDRILTLTKPNLK